VRRARKINYISYDEMLELAGAGAQVMYTRSIEVAKRFGVDIYVRSTFSRAASGTIITSEEKLNLKGGKMEDVAVSAITFDKNQANFSIIDFPDKPGIASKVFCKLAKEGINIDMIVQPGSTSDDNDISFSAPRSEFKKVMKVLEKLKKKLGAKDIIAADDVVKISIIGAGMPSHVGVAAKMFEVFAKKGITIEMISTSEIKVSCIVKEAHLDKALKSLHKAFGLS
jgi:aspartate kinase